MRFRVWILEKFRVVGTEKVLEKFMSLIFENLSFLSIMRIVHDTHY